MAFTDGIAFVFREVVTFTKMNQLVANLVEHDHRSDGTQGAVLVDGWTAAATVAPAAGWDVVDGNRYRSLLGGAVVALDLSFTRTGADLVAADTAAANPGNYVDTGVATGLPVEVRPESAVYLLADKNDNQVVSVRVNPDGSITLVAGAPSGVISTGSVLKVRGVVCRG